MVAGQTAEYDAEMEETQVLIVGAGPAGLTLGLALAKQKIHSVILEKELEIGDDPRGVYLSHDAVRILWTLGIGGRMKEIGYEPPALNFHRSSLINPPFLQIDTSVDAAGQTVPNGILQVQPLLERALRDAVTDSEYCSLRCGSAVKACEKDGDFLVISYASVDTSEKKIKSSYLVGADGKRGVVRKHFLEASAGIRQQDAHYRYDGTWIAANLRIVLPTPESHPSFPLWRLGYTPEEVYDLYWPIGWHFVSPPGKATATGRFGPHSERYWRHEFEQDSWKDDMDAEALFWEHITPMITRSAGTHGAPFTFGSTPYPRDCIKIVRCRPFRFTHKVVNRWFDDRTILIGDAAHVFPPFGGQGIASGIRDADQLSWRLALLCQGQDVSHEVTNQILSAWATERTSSVAAAAHLTRRNGELCNGNETMTFKALRYLDWIVKGIPLIPNFPSPVTTSERTGFQAVQNGFSSTRFGGGGRVAQLWVQQDGHAPVLSDTVFQPETGVLMLLVVDSSSTIDHATDMARDVIVSSGISPTLLSHESLVSIIRDVRKSTSTAGRGRKMTSTSYQICSPESLPESTVMSRCDSTEFMGRLGRQTRYALIRPDLYIYGMAADEKELRQCLDELKDRLPSSSTKG